MKQKTKTPTRLTGMQRLAIETARQATPILEQLRRLPRPFFRRREDIPFEYLNFVNELADCMICTHDGLLIVLPGEFIHELRIAPASKDSGTMSSSLGETYVKQRAAELLQKMRVPGLSLEQELTRRRAEDRRANLRTAKPRG